MAGAWHGDDATSNGELEQERREGKFGRGIDKELQCGVVRRASKRKQELVAPEKAYTWGISLEDQPLHNAVGQHTVHYSRHHVSRAHRTASMIVWLHALLFQSSSKQVNGNASTALIAVLAPVKLAPHLRNRRRPHPIATTCHLEVTQAI
jgi:hypothetical protein